MNLHISSEFGGKNRKYLRQDFKKLDLVNLNLRIRFGILKHGSVVNDHYPFRNGVRNSRWLLDDRKDGIWMYRYYDCYRGKWLRIHAYYDCRESRTEKEISRQVGNENLWLFVSRWKLSVLLRLNPTIILIQILYWLFQTIRRTNHVRLWRN